MFGFIRREKHAGRPTVNGGRIAVREHTEAEDVSLVREKTTAEERQDDIADMELFELDHPELRMRGWSEPRDRWRSSPLIAAALVAVFVTLPQFGPALGSTTGTPTDNGTQVAEQLLENRGVDVSGLTIEPTEDLALYGQPVIVYVNMFSQDDTISILPFAGTQENSFASRKGMYADYVTHEYGHILQKRLIEEVAPGGGWAHTAKVLELNAVLADHSPAPTEDRHSQAVGFAGLETNADCITVALRGAAGRSAYLGDTAICDAEAIATALSVIEGDWPTDANIDRWAATNSAERKVEADRVAAASNICEITIGADGRRQKDC